MLNSQHRPEGAVMDADLDSLLTVVFCTADDLLPDGRTDQVPHYGRRDEDG